MVGGSGKVEQKADLFDAALEIAVDIISTSRLTAFKKAFVQGICLKHPKVKTILDYYGVGV